TSSSPPPSSKPWTDSTPACAADQSRTTSRSRPTAGPSPKPTSSGTHCPISIGAAGPCLAAAIGAEQVPPGRSRQPVQRLVEADGRALTFVAGQLQVV